MKFIVTVILLTVSIALVHGQTAAEIEAEYQQVYNRFNTEATAFVNYLASELDKRLLDYIAAHQKLITFYSGIALVPGVVLTAENVKIPTEIVAKVTELIALYPTVLDRQIFSNEYNRYLELLNNGYLKEAKTQIQLLGDYVTKYPKIADCWTENKNDIYTAVGNAILSARNYATNLVNTANTTLNTNELLIDGQLAAAKASIDTCKLMPTPEILSQCVNNYVFISGITFPGNANLYETTTKSAVSNNLMISDVLIQSTATIAYAQIKAVIPRIEFCVSNAITKGTE